MDKPLHLDFLSNRPPLVLGWGLQHEFIGQWVSGGRHIARNFKGGSQSFIQAPFWGKYTTQTPLPTISPKFERWVWITPWKNYEVQSSTDSYLILIQQVNDS